MAEWLGKLFRIQRWIYSYNRNDLKGDILAGITTGAMLIPQGMAYAVIAGAPPIYGLYSGVVPLLIYPLMGTSRHISIGPVALDMLIVAAAFERIGPLEPLAFISLAFMVTLFTGLTQVLLGTLRLGFVFKFFSRPVISGFTIAAPIIIISSQIGSLTGIEVPNSQYFYSVLYSLGTDITQLHYVTFATGFCSILFLAVLRYTKPKLPASVFLVILGIIASAVFHFESAGISIVGNIKAGLPNLKAPDISFAVLRDLLPIILTLALVQFMNVASLGRAFAKRHGYIIDPNHELIAVGTSNVAGAFFQSLPVSASFSRSAASERAGGKTAFANVITSLIIIISLLALTPYFYFLPEAVLSAIIIVSVAGLVDLKEIRYLFKTKRSEGLVAVFTALATLLIGIQDGILLGVLVSLLVVIFLMSRPNVAELGLKCGTRTFKNKELDEEAEDLDDIIILRVDAAFSFINAKYFRDYILEKSEQQNQNIHYVIIDGSTINDLDITAIDALKNVAKTLKEWDISLYITSLKAPVRKVVARSGLKDYLGEDHFCRSPHQAVQRVLEKLDKEDGGNRLQNYLEKAG